jgi:hypothetical protein
MTIFDAKIEEAIDKGLAKQVVLADGDGFILDNIGYVYDPDELVAIFMSTQKQMEDGVLRFDFGQISEFSFLLVGTDMTIACRRVFWPAGGCLVAVVVPVGASHNLIISNVIRAYGRYMEQQLAALRKT